MAQRLLRSQSANTSICDVKTTSRPEPCEGRLPESLFLGIFKAWAVLDKAT